ncbi:MAG: leucine-rich repeat domain-containing protein, partial [Proteobacteria bacterium]|nr:leucine-rich repeat domain-containing protein [Pseudomonadota bacterium]
MTDKEDDQPKSLVIRPGALTVPGRKSAEIVSRMVDGALVIARRKDLDAPRMHRVGDFELCAPDYRQISRWAEELGQSPERVLEVLASGEWEPPFPSNEEVAHFRVENGRIKQLVFDGNLLPIKQFQWEPGLAIETLVVSWCLPTWPADAALPTLREFGVHRVTAKSLDLAPVPQINVLWCDDNQLTELDLSPVPGLTKLVCGSNQLTELDLSPVPGLTELRCNGNHLTELDLSPVPGLTELWCNSNELTELDLSPVPGLTELWCGSNELTELDLSPVPGLTELSCMRDQLTELDLSPVPGLTKLSCFCNKLTELDLS